MNTIHWILDEAAVLGRLEPIENALTIGRGYGIRLNLIYQSLGQLRQCFPDGNDVTVLSNTSQIFLSINDNSTADYVSAKLGDSTIILNSGGTTTGSSTQYTSGCHPSESTGTSTSYSDNWSYSARRLLKPEELQNLPDRVAITFTPGMLPICSWMLRYYEETDLYKAASKPKKIGKQSAFKSFLLCVSLSFCALLLTRLLIDQQKSQNNSDYHDQPAPVRQRTNQRRSYVDQK